LSLIRGTVLAGLGVGLEAVQAEVLWVNKDLRPNNNHRQAASQEQELATLQHIFATASTGLETLELRAVGVEKEILAGLKMLIADQDLFDAAKSGIESGLSASRALALAIDAYDEVFAEDPVLLQRITDIRGVVELAVARIYGQNPGFSIPETGRFVLVVENLAITDFAYFTKAVVGVISLHGGPTSHAAIVLRANSIPAVFACRQAAELVAGQLVLVDPVADRVVVGASISEATSSISLARLNPEPLIPVLANIGSLPEAISAAASAASGVGLFRTELLYLNQSQKPSIKEQVQSYRDIFSASPSGAIVTRTLDPAEDKPLAFLEIPKLLPKQGYVVLSHHLEILTEQLSSIEEARRLSGREIWVMAPMIHSPQEAKKFAELARAIGDYKVGIMVETPSIALAIGELQGQLDFISVGTNDLLQLLFEADRLNAAPGTFLNHWEPHLLQLLERIAADSLLAGISSGVCGESASDPVFAIVLAGLGYKSLSASASMVGEVRNALSAVSFDQAQFIAKLALEQITAETARAVVVQELSRLQAN
jgi:phosphotransferase system enzyme I (PtsI)